MSEMVFAVGLAATCIGVWLVLGWAGVAIVVGCVAMAFGVLRQLLGRG